VLETGCGRAEVLVRVLERYTSATGLGVDSDADWLARARANADARIPGREVDLVAATADDADLEPRSFDAVVNVAASHAHGGYPAALGALAALAAPGGVVLLGEGFWARTPSPAFLEALGGAAEDELGTLDDLLRHARSAGLEPIFESVASPADWARYEETLAGNAEARGDEDSLAYARRIRARRELPGGADTMGFVLLVLRA
jgi:SAM-dependent methyltransferase